MEPLLPKINSPVDLRALSQEDLERLAKEMRETLCDLVQERPAHFASNLGVVELCLALHTVFDFRRDRLIWDTGHQIYPHKLITGRYKEFGGIRTRGGLMGYPNPAESEYDLFVTGHAGSSVSTVVGLKMGDVLNGEPDRCSVAVIGDGAFPSGVVYEAMNNAGELKQPLIVILNDNEMSICPRVGGVAQFFDKLRTNPWYRGFKNEVHKFLEKIPTLGETTEQFLSGVKDSVKAGFNGGMLFEDLGFRYIGPIDGHDIKLLQQYLKMVKGFPGPILLHVVTQKGKGFTPAEVDPVTFHAPSPFERKDDCVVSIKKSSTRSYTHAVSDAIYSAMEKDPKVAVITAAMCQGNNLGQCREKFPERFFDVGICEAHAVAFAAGMAKTGIKPIVDIYSTFLQRSFDHIFQEAALQNLPVVFTLDRAGLAGPDGATHHGCFDVGYMRLFPNMVCMAPGDERDVAPMLDFALNRSGPTSIRYPKANLERIDRAYQPIELGKSEVLEWGEDGMLIACGTLVTDCLKAAEKLKADGLDVGVINARFIKPLDTEVICKAVDQCGFVLTVEEGALAGGFGSAVLEAVVEAGLDTRRVRRLGIPDRFVEHGERAELLNELDLDVSGIVAHAREMAAKAAKMRESASRVERY